MLDSPIPLQKLNEIVTMVMQAAEAESVPQTLQRIAHVARELVGAKYAALGVPDGHGGMLHFKVSGISEEEVAQIEHPPVGEGLLGVIMNEREILRLPHMRDDPRAVGFPKGHPPMESLLGVPVQAGDHLFGMLYLTDREDNHPFTLTDQWLVETLAGYAALAIAGSQLRHQSNRLTLLEERQRIAMELHDGVIQSLYAIGMQLDLVRLKSESGTDGINAAINGLNTIIEDIRSYILDLKSRQDRMTIRTAIDDVLAKLYVPKSLVVSIDAPDIPPPFSDTEFESVCFIAREGLSNVMRHSKATHVTVRCWQENDHFHLSIRDDGGGFDPTQSQNQEGLGLRNMHERASQLGGELNITSNPGDGTLLLLTIPL